MGKTKTANKKKMVRISPYVEKRILIMRKNGFSLRQIAKAFDLTHPAVLYFLRKAEK